MSISLRKHAAMFLAATFTVGSMATFGAAALDQPTAVLSSTLNHSVGTVLTSAEISNCLLYTSPSPRDVEESRMPSSA